MPFDIEAAVHNAQQRLRRALKQDVARHLASYNLRNVGIFGVTHLELSVEPVAIYYHTLDKPAFNYPTRVRRTAEILSVKPYVDLSDAPLDFSSVPHIDLPGLWLVEERKHLSRDMCSIQLIQVVA